MPRCPVCRMWNPPEEATCRACGASLPFIAPGEEAGLQLADVQSAPAMDEAGADLDHEALEELPEEDVRRCAICGAEIPASAAYLVPRGEGKPDVLCPACAFDFRMRFTGGFQPACTIVSAVPEEQALPEQHKEGEKERCAFCEAAIAPGHAVVTHAGWGWGRVSLCPTCAAALEADYSAETQDIAIYRAILGGAGAAIVAGAAWYLLEQARPGLVPFMALVSGGLIGAAVHFAAGRKRGRSLQWLALALTALTIVGTELALLGRGATFDFPTAWGLLLQDPWIAAFSLVGLWLAYRTPAPRRMQRVPPQGQ